MKVITWNMQGAKQTSDAVWLTTLPALFSDLGADVCCLQECGPLPSQAINDPVSYTKAMGPNLTAVNVGSKSRPKYVLYYLWDAKGNRCNLAIAPRDGNIIATSVVTAPGGLNWRPTVGIQLSNGSWVYTLHAISPGGADAPGLLDATFKKHPKTACAVFGDYNREPDNLEASLAKHGVMNATICKPNTFTHSVKTPKSTYDYMVNNVGLAVTGSVISTVTSDHFPVEFDL